MNQNTLVIPSCCCEHVINIRTNEPKPNHFKVNRGILEEMIENADKLIKNKPSTILMGNGFIYNGEIYHKNKQYVYFYIY